jgi:hypothetical protein
VQPLESFHNILLEIQAESSKFTYTAYQTMLRSLRDYFFLKKDRVISVRDMEGNIILILDNIQSNHAQIDQLNTSQQPPN